MKIIKIILIPITKVATINFILESASLKISIDIIRFVRTIVDDN